MSDNIIQVNQEIIHTELKDLVRIGQEILKNKILQRYCGKIPLQCAGMECPCTVTLQFFKVRRKQFLFVRVSCHEHAVHKESCDLRIFLLRENALPFLFRVLAEFCEQPVPVLEEAVVGAV